MTFHRQGPSIRERTLNCSTRTDTSGVTPIHSNNHRTYSTTRYDEFASQPCTTLGRSEDSTILHIDATLLEPSIGFECNFLNNEDIVLDMWREEWRLSPPPYTNPPNCGLSWPLGGGHVLVPSFRCRQLGGREARRPRTYPAKDGKNCN